MSRNVPILGIMMLAFGILYWLGVLRDGGPRIFPPWLLPAGALVLAATSLRQRGVDRAVTLIVALTIAVAQIDWPWPLVPFLFCAAGIAIIGIQLRAPGTQVTTPPRPRWLIWAAIGVLLSTFLFPPLMSC